MLIVITWISKIWLVGCYRLKKVHSDNKSSSPANNCDTIYEDIQNTIEPHCAKMCLKSFVTVISKEGLVGRVLSLFFGYDTA